jgi:hypothetical protein
MPVSAHEQYRDRFRPNSLFSWVNGYQCLRWIECKHPPKWLHKQRDALAFSVSANSERQGPDWLLCVRCAHRITWKQARRAMHGVHEHTQINPHGYIWQFGCFTEAPGCCSIGAPSSEFSWFVGYSWQIQHCRSCGLHLGWFFGNGDPFYALILARLVELTGGADGTESS